MLTYSGYSEEVQPAADTQREYMEEFLAREETKMETLIRQSVNKPSIARFGYMQLSEKEFEDTFDSKLYLYLKHLFEWHRGEAIVIERTACTTECEVPLDEQVHVFNEYYYCPYVGMSEELEEELEELIRRAKEVAPLGKLQDNPPTPTQRQSEHFAFLRQHPNTVFQPVSGETLFKRPYNGGTYFRSHSSTVRYHTLPSLVYELIEYVQLQDIYSFFCEQDRLISRKPHSQGKQSKKSQQKKGYRRGWWR